MKITNFDLVGIGNILEQFGNYKLPQRISYAITKNGMILKKDYSVYEAELKKILNQYSEYMIKDENGNYITGDLGIPLVEPKYKDEFNEVMSELLNIEIDVDFYHIDSSLFEYDDSDKYDALSPKDIITLQSILCEEV